MEAGHRMWKWDSLVEGVVPNGWSVSEPAGEMVEFHPPSASSGAATSPCYAEPAVALRAMGKRKN